MTRIFSHNSGYQIHSWARVRISWASTFFFEFVSLVPVCFVSVEGTDGWMVKGMIEGLVRDTAGGKVRKMFWRGVIDSNVGIRGG